jgi:hypothetical protein
MPLVKELVHAEKSDPPIYTRDKKKKCDWGIIFEKPTGCDFTFPPQLSPIEQYEYLQETVETSRRLLDETQMLAIENYLKNRVSLIQVNIDIYIFIIFLSHVLLIEREIKRFK